MRDKNWVKTNIGVGYFVIENNGKVGGNNSKGRISMKRNDVEGCVRDVVSNLKFLVQLKYGQKRVVGYFLLTHVCSEEEVDHEVNKPISYLTEKYCELLTIGDNPVDEE